MDLNFRWCPYAVIAASLLILLDGCMAPTPISPDHTHADTRPAVRAKTVGADFGAHALAVVCPTSTDVPIARYVGPYLGMDNVLTPKDFAQDLFCAEEFKANSYPSGFVTVFGSSRIREHNVGPNQTINAENDRLYTQVQEFAHEWTVRYGKRYPILTGAGPGLMEAASRGAIDVGPSIGYTTYYDPPSTPSPTRPYGGNPAAAFWKYQGRDLLTDGLIFSSIAMRETAMIRHSAAILITPGGTGTEWETFEILEMIKSKQLAKVPIYVVGTHDVNWKSFDDRLADMVARGTLRSGEALDGVEFVDDPTEAIERLRARLGLD